MLIIFIKVAKKTSINQMQMFINQTRINQMQYRCTPNDKSTSVVQVPQVGGSWQYINLNLIPQKSSPVTSSCNCIINEMVRKRTRMSSYLESSFQEENELKGKSP